MTKSKTTQVLTLITASWVLISIRFAHLDLGFLYPSSKQILSSSFRLDGKCLWIAIVRSLHRSSVGLKLGFGRATEGQSETSLLQCAKSKGVWKLSDIWCVVEHAGTLTHQENSHRSHVAPHKLLEHPAVHLKYGHDYHMTTGWDQISVNAAIEGKPAHIQCCFLDNERTNTVRICNMLP